MEIRKEMGDAMLEQLMESEELRVYVPLNILRKFVQKETPLNWHYLTVFSKDAKKTTYVFAFK